jgi:protein HOOK3
VAETELQRQTDIVTDLTRANDELQVKADGYDKVKDQLDE